MYSHPHDKSSEAHSPNPSVAKSEQEGADYAVLCLLCSLCSLCSAYMYMCIAEVMKKLSKLTEREGEFQIRPAAMTNVYACVCMW